jgi:tRNA(Ile)-lysidine synthase
LPVKSNLDQEIPENRTVCKIKVVTDLPPMPLQDRVTAVIHRHRLFGANDCLIVAVSGGSDSMALLHILHHIDLPLRLVAVYVDHGLRPEETPQEQKIIAANCLALHIPFRVRSVGVRELVARGQNSPEEAARILRYSALEEIRREYGASVIAVGHSADDQVEQFFIRLLRGSSRRGLSGMMVKRDHIVRPLLFEKKTTLMAFLADRGVSWCLDSSNLDRRFLRNGIRLDLLPLLEEKFNPAVRKTILQAMDILAAEDGYLKEQTDRAYGQCVEMARVPIDNEQRRQLIIDSGPFLACHPAIRRRIIEQSCWQMDIRPTYEQICTLGDLIACGKNGSEVHLGDGVRAEKSSHTLRLFRPLPKGMLRGSSPCAPPVTQIIPGAGIYPIAGTDKELVLEEREATTCRPTTAGELLVDRAELSFPLLLRSALPGEKFHPCGGPGSKKISRFFNERKIPARERSAWPVLLSGGRVVALVGLQLDHGFRLSAGTADILAISWRTRRT